MAQNINSPKRFFSNVSRNIRDGMLMLFGLVFICFTVSYLLDSIEYAFTSECGEGETRTLYCYKIVEAKVVKAKTEMRAKRRLYLDVDLLFADGRAESLTFHYYKDQKAPQPKEIVNIEIWRGKFINLEKDGEVFVAPNSFWINFSKMDGSTRLTILLVFISIIALGIASFIFRLNIAKWFS